MQIPKFLQKLMSSPAYADKDSQEYAKATRYMQLLYPGKVSFDVTGRMIQPEYDMTYEQFLDAQKKFDIDMQNTIQEVEEEAEENGSMVDCSQFVEIEEKIDVLVLMPWGGIESKQLIIYMLNIPDEPGTEPEKTKKIWIWHSEDDERLCDDCASLNDVVFENKEDMPDIPCHPNCRCWVEEQELDDKGKAISGKVYKGQRPGTAKDDEKILSEKTSTFDKPINIKPGQSAKFDGKNLTIYQDGKPIASWRAVSGNKDFQKSDFQNLKSKGPIPEGTYVARQEKLQYITSYGLVVGLLNKGTWPGSLYSWGSSRIALEASKETNTFDRGGFYVHGGWEPGSNGCIDLTSQMDDFTKWFENNGHDLIINVKYQR